jgi:hypothetical protein
MRSLIVLLSCFGLSSCMHVGMMGTSDSHHSGAAHEMTTQPVLEKEVIVGDVKAIALFPPLDLGEGVLLTLRLTDVRTGRPLTGATVFLHAAYVHDPATEHADPSPSANHQTQGHGLIRTEAGHDIDFSQQVDESSDPGVYTISYGSHQLGNHTLMFHITAIGDRRLDPEITLEATRTVPAEGHDHQGGMMGGTGTTTYLIIGVAVMGAIMVAMLAARGGMF